MKKRIPVCSLILIYITVLAVTLCIVQIGSRTVTVMVESAQLSGRPCIVIDPGHGGIDGGATSCTGILESQLNLEIALRLNDLLHLLGHDTRLIRDTDTSIYTEGETIASQKISDLKNRVSIVNETENALLISIHQNTFQDSRYNGAQVFYADNETSLALASMLQAVLVDTVNEGSTRKCKRSDGIYLMQNIKTTGILIECGFLTNPEEEAKLRDGGYQKMISAVIATTVARYLSQKDSL